MITPSLEKMNLILIVNLIQWKKNGQLYDKISNKLFTFINDSKKQTLMEKRNYKIRDKKKLNG